MNTLYRVEDIKTNLRIARFRPLDVLVVGETGAGKSSTINALFTREVNAVGRGYAPETMSISASELNDSFRIWDSPGLGDNVERDKEYAKGLVDILYKDYFLENMQYGVIDMVVVILDGSGRDMGTIYKLLSDVIVPNFQSDRIYVAINQADLAMKGRHWNECANCPDIVLRDFLDRKAESVRNRLAEATGVKVRMPVYYSAERGYNVEKFMDMIIDNMPRERRKLVA